MFTRVSRFGLLVVWELCSLALDAGIAFRIRTAPMQPQEAAARVSKSAEGTTGISQSRPSKMVASRRMLPEARAFEATCASIALE